MTHILIPNSFLFNCEFISQFKCYSFFKTLTKIYYDCDKKSNYSIFSNLILTIFTALED
jgi:hypothetical protein